MGNQGVPLRRGGILIHKVLSPESKTELCIERGKHSGSCWDNCSAERLEWPAPLEGSECGRGGQTLRQESQVCSDGAHPMRGALGETKTLNQASCL